MKVVILARVSTEEQKEAGNSLPAQQARMHAYISRNRTLELVKEFVFDESAYKDHRKEFALVIDYIKQQKEKVGLLCDKVDRLSRDFLVGLVEIEKLRRSGKIELHFPSDNLILHDESPATDLFHYNIAVSLAQYYSNSISDNVKRANEQKLRSGEWIGKAPLGYLNIGTEKNNKEIVVDESRRHHIEKIYNLYASGTSSMLEIKNIVTSDGLRSKKGNKLSKSMIENILKNPFYCGTMISKGREFPHKYESIVSRYTFDQVQKVRRAKQKLPFKSVSHPFVFKGLMTCADCGCRITHERKKKKQLNYYSCTNSKGICKRIYVNEKQLLEPVYKTLRTIQLSDAQIQEITEKIRDISNSKNKYHTQQVKSLRDQYDVLQTRCDNLLDLMLDGSITKSVYDKKFKQLKEKQRDIELQLEEHTNADENYCLSATQLLSLAQRAAEIFESSEIEEKRQLLNFVFQNLQLKGRNMIFELKTPLHAVAEYKKRPVLLPR